MVSSVGRHLFWLFFHGEMNSIYKRTVLYTIDCAALDFSVIYKIDCAALDFSSIICNYNYLINISRIGKNKRLDNLRILLPKVASLSLDSAIYFCKVPTLILNLIFLKTFLCSQEYVLGVACFMSSVKLVIFNYTWFNCVILHTLVNWFCCQKDFTL